MGNRMELNARRLNNYMLIDRIIAGIYTIIHFANSNRTVKKARLSTQRMLKFT